MSAESSRTSLSRIEVSLSVLAGALALLVVAGGFRGPRGGPDPRRGSGTLEETIRVHYVAGLSLDDVDHFGLGSSEAAENLAKLKSWLRSEAWEPWHANIVRAIGLLGEGSGDMNLLLEYASSPGRAERLSYAEYGARQEAFISAGDVVARTIALDKTDMVSRLITRAQPSYWLANPPDWTSPYEEPASFIAQHLARLALIGLGYTRTRKAEEFLGPLAKDAPVGWTDPVDREFQKDVGDIIQEARERNGMLPR